jgi:signal transduction histidine kinase/CheY-like chemotaxis protein
MQTGRLLRIAVILAACAVMVAQLLANVLLTERAERAALAAADETTQRVARSVEATMNRSFLQVDSMLLGLPTLLAPFLANGPEGSFDVTGASRLLRELNNQNLTIRDILLVGADGLPVVTALAVSRRRPLPLPLGPDYMAAGLPGAGLRVGGPVRNPVTGEWSLFFARPLEILGVGRVTAVAELPVPVLAGLLGAGGEPEGLRATLELRDGTLLAALPHDETRIGRRFDQPIGQAPMDISRFDNQSVLATERPTLYPSIAIRVTLDRDVALRAWRLERNRAFLVSLALSALVIALVAAMLVALRQRARVEEERVRWRQTLESALESMTEGFVMYDSDDRIVTFNQRYREIYAESAAFIHEGALFDDIIRGGLASGQYPTISADSDAFIAELRAWRRSGGAPLERLMPNGRWVLITERPTPDGGTVGIRTDITAIKEAMREVEAAADAKTMFLARMSHELRTPLNAILGFAQVLLSDRDMTPAQYEQLRLLHEAAAHLRELVNGLLDLAKINAGKLELEDAPLALGTLLEGCVGFLGPEARRKQISLRLLPAPDLPAGVAGDATRLRQMILNLLSNAVKFTPVGGWVELRAAPLPAGIRIEVRDSGPGVPYEKRHLLFQDFTQLGSLSDAESPGTGLGLSITARLATLMGGHFGLESEAGQGAIFWLELPLEAATPPALPPRLDPATRAARPLRILVADDIAPNRMLMRAMLGTAGHDVTLVADGVAALAALQGQTFDAVLMDVRMPGMDGLEATRRLRALPGPERNLPVIAVTASALPEEIAECRAAGMDTHVAKPVERVPLLALLAALGASAPEGMAELPHAEQGAAAARLMAELGRDAEPLLRSFVEELDAIAAILKAEVALADTEHGTPPRETLNDLVRRAQAVAGNIGAPALSAALDAAQRQVRVGATPGEVLARLRPVLMDETPLLRAVVERLLAASQPVV